MTAPPEPAFESLVAALNERYSIEREIGRGGMARVYLARDIRHERDVAIKVLDPQLSAMLGAERFLREIRITAQLTHPNIIPLLDSGQAGELLYYVTPFAPGESLRARLAREGQLAVRDALRIAREMADAIEVAHRAGIVHRDVKPENVLLIGGHAVVCDFGIARALSAAANDSLTQTGVSLGTPAYMSPEQAVGAPNIDARADIYALGCVLYELLAGDPPFTGSNVQRIMAQHATSPVPSVRLARPAAPEAIERVVTRALEKVPADRFATAGEMRDAIDTILEASDTGGVSLQAVAPSRWRPRVIIAGLALAAVGASAVLIWRRDAASSASAVDGLATRVAVLPMVNLSSEPADQYLADGMTEALISTLSNIGGLHVIARGSVLAYAGTKQSAAEIGRALNVGSLIESTYQKVGNQLRIRVHLVDVATQEDRWSEPYDREANVANVFAIQRDISTRVAQALRVHLLPGETQRVAKRLTDNDQAYDLYLRARLLRHDQVNSPVFRAALDTATNMLQQAVALDPSFAAAHAELARVYISRLFQFEPNSDLQKRAEAEITRVLALDSTLAEAYFARGDLAYTSERGWQLENAMRDYQHAIALSPNFADVHAAFGSLLFHVGLLDDARRELDMTLMLDPANRFVPPRISRVMWYAGQYDSALARMDRGSGPPVEHGLVLGYLGRATAGMAVLDSIAAAGRVDYDVTAARAVLFARLGRRAEAEAQIDATTKFEPRGSHFHHAEFAIGSAYALLGRTAEAELWLERMANDGMPNYALLANDPTLAILRRDPKFQEFLSRERARNERLKAIMHQ